MKFKVIIKVSLKACHSDPKRQIKKRRERQDEMCKRPLANPTKDNYTFTVEETK